MSGPPFVIDEAQSQTINESDSLLLTCNFGGNPSPNVSWFRDSDEVLATGSVLFISSANRSHAGSYQCVASNGFGNPVTSKATVLVNCKLLLQWLLECILTCLKMKQKPIKNFQEDCYRLHNLI